MKKLLQFFVTIFLTVCIMCGCSSKPSGTEEQQTMASAAESVSFVEHNYHDLSFEAPEDLTLSESDDGYYLYKDSDMLIVYAIDVSELGIKPIEGQALSKTYYEDAISGVLSQYDSDEKITLSQTEIINNLTCYQYNLTGLLSETQTNINAYLIYNSGYLYHLLFYSQPNKGDPNFESIEKSIINSVKFETVEAPTEEATVEPTDPPKLGKADNPAPLGETVEIYESDMTILNISITNVIAGEEANRLVKEYNQFNDDPPEGYHYVLFDVNVECASTNKSGGFRVRYSNFCAANSTKAILKTTSVAVVLDNYLDATLLPGSMVTGKSAVLMPNDGDGYIVYDDRYFFALS